MAERVHALISLVKPGGMGNSEIQACSLPSDDPSLALSTIEMLRHADTMA